MNDEPENELTETDITGSHPAIEKLVQHPRTWRFVRVGIILFTVVIIAVFVVRPYIVNLLPSSDSGSTSAPFRFIVLTNVSYATVKVNGVIVTTKPNDSTKPFLLQSGKNMTIQLIAPPYQPISCTITSVANPTPEPNFSRCGILNILGAINDKSKQFAVIDMNFLPSDLTTGIRQQLLDYIPTLIEKVNSKPLPVASNTHYATGNGAIFPITAISTTPLMAQLVYDINAIPSSFCVGLLCPSDNLDAKLTDTSQYSSFSIQLNLLWKFSQLNGQLVTTYSILNRYNSQNPLDFNFRYSTSTGWQVSDTDILAAQQQYQTFSDTSMCSEESNVISNRLANSPLSQGGPMIEVPLGLTTTSGCIFSLQSIKNNAVKSSDPIHDNLNAWFMVHFGAVLAVSDPAHALIPELERATPEEVNEILAAQHN